LRKLPRSYYRQNAEALAEDLIGKILIHRVDGVEFRARIVETEAYVGPEDLASHTSRGRTKRTEIMFGPAGHAYVYFIYGMYDMLNVVAGPTGSGQAVLIRAAEPLNGWTADLSGPGKLCRAMKIRRAHNGIDLTGKSLFICAGSPEKLKVIRTKRIGVDYAKHWKDAPLRFIDSGSPAISRKGKNR